MDENETPETPETPAPLGASQFADEVRTLIALQSRLTASLLAPGPPEPYRARPRPGDDDYIAADAAEANRDPMTEPISADPRPPVDRKKSWDEWLEKSAQVLEVSRRHGIGPNEY